MQAAAQSLVRLIEPNKLDRKGKPRSESSYWPTKGGRNISLRYLQYVHPEYPNTDIFKEPRPALFKKMVFCVP